MPAQDIENAIAFLRVPGARLRPKEDEDANLGYICRDWLRDRKHNLAVCAAAAKVGHAGLEYLATEADWIALLKNGKHDAKEVIHAILANESIYGLQETLEEYDL